MSWYTTIYPEGEFDPTLTKEKIQENVKEHKHMLEYLWERITGICVANPSLYKVKDPLEYIINLVQQHFNKYIEVSNAINYLYLNDQYLDSKEWIKNYPPEDDEPCRPYLSYNHYSYEHNPKEGIQNCEDALSNVRKMIIAYACASPKDILVKNNAKKTEEDCEYNDAIRYILDELEEYKEWLDTELYDLAFSKLCVKYWDTHEVG